MILFTFKNQLEDRKHDTGEPFLCDAFRWTFQVSRDAVGFVHQHRSRDSGAWSDSHTNVFEVARHRHFFKPSKWRVAIEHVYYDGCHCMLILGPILFQWGGKPFTGRCKKCEGDE